MQKDDCAWFVMQKDDCAWFVMQDDDGDAEDMPPPSTQTAALLADMAAEADGTVADLTQQVPSSEPSFLPSSQPLAVSVSCAQ